jgi:hypothetical protein
LNLSKQNKWLWKNNILSDKIILKSTSWTSLKKLYGNPILSSSSNNLNVWLSNKSNNAANFKKLLNVSLHMPTSNLSLVNVMGNYNYMLNFNHYEDSLFWVSKRYKFLQNLTNNVHSLSYGTGIETKVINPGSSVPINMYSFLISSTVLNYPTSQLGLASSSLLLPKSDFNLYEPNTPSQLVFSANKDILSAMDSEFILYLSSQTTLHSSHLNFFSSTL